jgi:hypothetical protein
MTSKPCPECGCLAYDPAGYYERGWSVNPARLNSEGYICNACYQRSCRAARRLTNFNVCSACNETFTPKRKDARFCSNACRQAAHRRMVTCGNGVDT